MSAEQEVATLLVEAGNSSADKAILNLDLAKQEVVKMLSTTGSSVFNLCTNIERARTKAEVKTAFTQFNVVARIFLEAAPRAEHDRLVRDSLCSVRLSGRLRSCLESATSVPEALAQYKARVVTDLAEVMRAQAAMSQLDDDRDDELLLRLLPQPDSPFLEEDLPLIDPDIEAPSKKRGFSSIDDLPKIPMKSKIPALASISRMHERSIMVTCRKNRR